jgi:integrase/recombinase XerD
MQEHIDQYLEWLQATNHAAATVRNQRTSLRRLQQWCTSATVATPADLTLEHLESFRLSLFASRTRAGRSLAWGTQAEYLGGIKSFLAWGASRGLIAQDPGAALRLPKRPLQLPLSILSARDIERVLHVPDCRLALGLRDRAMLEVLYSTGIRRAELAHLLLGDIDPVRRVALVRLGKGQRDRVVPCGTRAIYWVGRYLRKSRPRLLRAGTSRHLFISSRGTPLLLNRLSERVHAYLELAGMAPSGSCHLFRHSMATLLLEGGADVRDVQAILGHTNLATTARYTHVSIARLQDVHSRAHPAEAGRRHATVVGR